MPYYEGDQSPAEEEREKLIQSIIIVIVLVGMFFAVRKLVKK
jgi:hypothetical protein